LRQGQNLAAVAQRVVGRGHHQLGHSADVPGTDLIRLVLLFADHRENRADPLIFFLERVVDGAVGLERSRADFEQRDTADERVCDRLEHESGQGPVRIGLQRDGFAGRLRLNRFCLGGGRQAADQLIHREGDRPVGCGRPDKDRIERAAQYGRTDALIQFLIGEGLAAEVFLHQLLIGFRHRFVDGLAQALDLVGQCRRHVCRRSRAGFPVQAVRLAVHDTDHAGHLAVLENRQRKGNHRLAIAFLQTGERLVKIGVGFVHAADHKRERDLFPAAQLDGFIGADRRTVLGADQDKAGVRHLNALHHFTDKIEIAGGVDQVKLVVVPGTGSGRCIKRDLPADFLRIKIHDCIAVCRPAHAVDDLGAIKHRFGKSRLARTAMAHKNKIVDLVCGKVFHTKNTPLIDRPRSKARQMPGGHCAFHYTMHFHQVPL